MKTTLWIGATLLAAAAVASAEVTKSESNRLTEAAIVLDEIRSAADRDIPEDLWEKAKCVAVIPSVKKAAFIFGGEFGDHRADVIRVAAAPFAERDRGERPDLVLLVEQSPDEVVER